MESFNYVILFLLQMVFVFDENGIPHIKYRPSNRPGGNRIAAINCVSLLSQYLFRSPTIPGLKKSFEFSSAINDVIRGGRQALAFVSPLNPLMRYLFNGVTAYIYKCK